jgi:hypothetical protein
MRRLVRRRAASGNKTSHRAASRQRAIAYRATSAWHRVMAQNGSVAAAAALAA